MNAPKHSNYMFRRCPRRIRCFTRNRANLREPFTAGIDGAARGHGKNAHLMRPQELAGGPVGLAAAFDGALRQADGHIGGDEGLRRGVRQNSGEAAEDPNFRLVEACAADDDGDPARPAAVHADDSSQQSCRLLLSHSAVLANWLQHPGGFLSSTAEPRITPELVAAHGLKPDEYERILALIGRPPTFTELGIFSAMWNEHCSYKSSRLHLRKLPTKVPGSSRARARTRASSTSAMAWLASSKWRATTTPPSSSPFKARRRALAESCAMSSPWARGRLLASISCASVLLIIRAHATSLQASLPGLAPMATASACRPLAARRISTRATTATSLSMRWPLASPGATRFSMRVRAASATRSSISAPRPAATAFTARPWPRPHLRRMPRPSAPRCRSAIPSPRSFCSRPASSSCRPARSSPSRTWAPRGLHLRRWRWAPRGTLASSLILISCLAERPA